MLNATACIPGPISISTCAFATFVELPIRSPLLLFNESRADFKFRPYHRKPEVPIGLGLVLIRPDSAQRHRGYINLDLLDRFLANMEVGVGAFTSCDIR